MSQRPLARLTRDISGLEVRGLEGRVAAVGGLLFLHLPLALIFLYAFTTEYSS